jgi:hypothetical protein
MSVDVKEEWQNIADYEEIYEVSNLGNVRNKKTKRVLKPSNRGGYLVVGLCKNSKGKSIAIHRLVATAFISNPENKPQVNHKDKVRNNNIVENLEWNNAAENNSHRSQGVIQTTNQHVKVWRINKDTNEKLEKYNSIEDAANWIVNNTYSPTFHTARGNISTCINGKYKSACGFKWEKICGQDLEGEVWRNVIIDGKEVSNYYVSDLGRFKNSKGIIMENYKPHHSGYIYLRVNKEKYALHRLVAFAFLDNPKNKPFVNHIDGNKTNNKLENLEFVTVQENCLHSAQTGLTKFYKRKIGQYNLENQLIKEYNSIKEAMDETNIKSIKEMLYGHQKHAGGFIWKYLN